MLMGKDTSVATIRTANQSTGYRGLTALFYSGPTRGFAPTVGVAKSNCRLLKMFLVQTDVPLIGCTDYRGLAGMFTS